MKWDEFIDDIDDSENAVAEWYESGVSRAQRITERYHAFIRFDCSDRWCADESEYTKERERIKSLELAWADELRKRAND